MKISPSAGFFRDKLFIGTECQTALIAEAGHVLVFGDGENDGFGEEKLSESEAFFSAYKEVKEQFSFDGAWEKAPKESSEYLKRTGENLDAIFGMWLCLSVCKERMLSGNPVKSSDFFEKEKEPENKKIAYIRNGYSDQVYDLFSKVIPGTSVVYPAGFAAACEEVYDGRCDFCMIPIETSSDGELHGFRQLTEKYELYRMFTAPSLSENPDGSQKTTRFALFSKSPLKITVDKNAVRAKYTDYLNIHLTSPSGEALTKVTMASELAGLRFVRSDSVPLSWDYGRYKCSLTFDITGKDAAPFLLWLTLEVPESEAVGIYTDISAEF